MRSLHFSFLSLVLFACGNTDKSSFDENLDNGSILRDVDGDGYTSDEDCDDNNSFVYPGATENCDGVDNNCDGVLSDDELDLDGDGYAACPSSSLWYGASNIAVGDCDDSTQLISPGQLEHCDGVDNDCDGEVDEDLEQLCETACETGLEFCALGSWVGCTAKVPFLEICNGLDDDCDGEVDENLDCLCTVQMVGALFPCYESPLVCGQGYKTCECFDEDCEQIFMSECFAMCSYEYPVPENCDKFKGNIRGGVENRINYFLIFKYF